MPTITDYFSKASNGTAPVPTTLASQKVLGATSMSLGVATGWDTTTPTHCLLYQVDANNKMVAGTLTIWKGLLTGTTVNSLTLKSGTDTNYSAGSVVELAWTSAQADDLVTGLLVQHNQDGTHGAITATSSTTTTGATVGRLQDSQGVTTTGTDLYTMRSETFTNFIASGCIWTADAAGSTLNGSMTSGVCYIAGKRLTVASVTAHAFTASKDTYVDFQDNGDGTAKLFYTAATNNAASSALGNSGTTANTIRNAIIVTGAGNIAAASSINQGQTDRVLPIASSVAYSVSDSLGNRIYPNNPNGGMIGYRQVTASQTPVTTEVAATGLSAPCIVPAGRSVKIKQYWSTINSGAANISFTTKVYSGVAVSGTLLQSYNAYMPAQSGAMFLEVIISPSSGLQTYSASVAASGAGGSYAAATTSPAFISVELV